MLQSETDLDFDLFFGPTDWKRATLKLDDLANLTPLHDHDNDH